MRCPSEDDLRSLNSFVFVDSDKVGESLARVASSGFEANDRFARELYELVENSFSIVVVAVLELSERTDADDIAVATHDRNSLSKVFALVTVHNDTHFSFEFPAISVDVENDAVHAKVESGFLCRESCAETRVEENEEHSLVFAKMLISERVVLDLLSLFESSVEVADIVDSEKLVHIYEFYY